MNKKRSLLLSVLAAALLILFVFYWLGDEPAGPEVEPPVSASSVDVLPEGNDAGPPVIVAVPTAEPNAPPTEPPTEEATEAPTEEATEAPATAPPTEAPTEAPTETPSDEPALLAEDGVYTSKEDVGLYIHQYGCLPHNFITKREAQDLGWTGGSLEPYAPGMCIGGDRFGNYEGALPTAKGRKYTECDIDTLGKRSRGAKRIIFSNDGLIYYTEDHYETFTLLYGEE